MSKEDKIIEILARITLTGIIAFCFRFNYKMYH